MKAISIIIVVIVIFGTGYLLFGKYRRSASDRPMTVMVENTPMVNGTLAVPAGFPRDIPLDRGEVLESATTQYPAQNARQLSVSYQSSKTAAQKYAEYKNYLETSGYEVTEGDANAPVRGIFGTKADANLSVVISSSEGKTLVQLSYLLKSASR